MVAVVVVAAVAAGLKSTSGFREIALIVLRGFFPTNVRWQIMLLVDLHAECGKSRLRFLFILFMNYVCRCVICVFVLLWLIYDLG